MSMPTSMTAVETSTSYSRSRKAAITRSFSAGRIRPCSRPTRTSGKTSVRSRSYSSVAALRLDLLRLLHQWADHERLPPAGTSSAHRLVLRAALASGRQRVPTDACRPGGSSSITETSRSPCRVSARLRGIGVAVITSSVGQLCPFSRSRGPLDDAEAVLLVHRGEAEVGERTPA